MKKPISQLLTFLIVLPAFVIGGCGTTSYLVDTHYLQDYPVPSIEASDPSACGPYKYITYSYGSGNDKRRKEYRNEIDFKTEPVDARPFMGILDNVPNYWGFDFDKLPVNGRVWFPQDTAPFPLVLIVHGNHNMKDLSDPGYEYLGKLLASRGFITVSVDENFLNQKFSGENDARAFILLEHLKVWRKWNETEGHKFEGKVNMERIALIGHSRGGESVAHAAAFNRLSRYPDEANIKFDYNFSIRSVFAIAPCDGQYKPAGHPTSIENVNYLVIQGGHDADVTNFMGLNQFHRVKFTGENFCFKSSVYAYRANHSRFNSAWGKMDHGAPLNLLLNDRAIMDEESQRQVAKVLISAFLEASINNKEEYLPIFKDIRTAGEWLPDDIYVSQYEDSNFKVIADFDEDFDVTTTTIPGGHISCENVKTWKEAHTSFRDGNKSTQNNSTVVLGWDNEEHEGVDSNDTGYYAIDLEIETIVDTGMNKDSSLVFSIGTEDSDQHEPLDLTIELRDSDDKIAKLPLSSIGPVHPALQVRLVKWKWLEKKYIEDFSERLGQTYEIPISHFIENNPSFDPTRLKSIRFILDRSKKGSIMLDDIGVSP